eukprot:13865031-Alexandrium_andersonii.AAC.1
MACAVASGGQIRITTAADSTRIVLTRPAWVMVSWPMRIAVAAAEAGVTASLKVVVEGAVGWVWQAAPTRVREPVRVERRW